MIKCIIFDCDGTLVDSEYLCNLGLEIKLREYGIDLSAHEIMEKYLGGKLATTLQAIESEHKIDLKDDFVPSYRALVSKLFKESLKPCEGVHKMLSEIDLPKCVASNGPLEKMHLSLAISGLTDYFHGKLFSAFDVGIWKPDPGIFLHVAKEMGFQPNECAVVEDSPVGILAAKSAGMFSVLYDPKDIHSAVKDTCKIRHMQELLSAVT
jgi:HAD superfamily hydrolase (TIGR01509 family)